VTDGEGGVADQQPAQLPRQDRAELLYRQVHPSWIADGIPSSQAFNPTKKDKGKLSIALGSKTTAEGAFLHHVDVLGFASTGTWAITVGEASDAGRNAFEEPLDDDPAHGFVDFQGLTRGAAERAAKILVARACVRGCLHPRPERAN
jgi:hypothetical protein